MWPDSDRIMAASQAADELERIKQSINAKAAGLRRATWISDLKKSGFAKKFEGTVKNLKLLINFYYFIPEWFMCELYLMLVD